MRQLLRHIEYYFLNGIYIYGKNLRSVQSLSSKQNDNALINFVISETRKNIYTIFQDLIVSFFILVNNYFVLT